MSHGMFGAQATAKFIQISASTYVDAEGIETENLYALDDDGRVWWFSFSDSEWSKLPSKRDVREPKGPTR